MADSNKNIVITPNRGSLNQPNIVFTGNANVAMTLRVADDNSLSFENFSGQLFSISNNVTTGTIFSVNDISGIPFVTVNASGNVTLVPLGGANVGIGTSSPQYPLDVYGNVRVSTGITAGNLSVINAAASTTTATGAILVPLGGVGIAGNITVGNAGRFGNIYVNNTTAATSATTGALIVAGGIGVAGNAFVNNSIWAGNINVTNTTAATSATTGALIVAGGVGITGNAFVSNSIWAGNINVTNTTAATSATTGALVVSGGVGITGNAFVRNSIWAGNLSVTNTTASTSSTTGALIVAGGIGVAGNVYVGGTMYGVATSATSAVTSVITNNTSGSTLLPTFVSSTSGNLALQANSSIGYVPSTGTLTSTIIVGTTNVYVGSAGAQFSNRGDGASMLIANMQAYSFNGTGFAHNSGASGNLYLPPLINSIWFNNRQGSIAALGAFQTTFRDNFAGNRIGSLMITEGTSSRGSGNALLFDTAPISNTGVIANYPSTVVGIVSGGTSGFAVNDRLIDSYNNSYQVSAVSSGVVTSVYLTTAAMTLGHLLPANPVSLTTVTGSGVGSVTVNLTWTTRSQIEIGTSSGIPVYVSSLSPSSATTPGAGIYLPGTNVLGLSTNTTERLRINASGNVGISVSNPTSLLDVNGTANFRSTVGVTGVVTAGGFAGPVNGSIGATTPNTGAFTTLTASGATSITNTTAATSATTGALIVAGGIGVAGNAFVNNSIWAGNINVTNTTAATSATTGALIVAGGIGVAGNAFVNNSIWAGNINVTNTTAATSATTGALIVAGGIGVAGNVVAGNSIWSGNLSVINAAASTTTATGAILVPLGGVGIAGNITVGNAGRFGNISVANTTQSTSTATGAVVNLGGEGIAGNLFVGGSINGANINVTSANAPPNGIWLPGTNILGFATNSSERMRIDANGNAMVGTSSTTAKLALSMASNLSQSPHIVLDSPVGQFKYIHYTSANSVRWSHGVDNTAESGSNAGSNFFLNRHNDSGVYINTALLMNRTSNTATFTGNVVVTPATTGSGVLFVGTTTGTSAINISTSTGGGGANYAGWFTLTNANSGATTPTKYIRSNSTGAIELINNAYNTVIMSLTDAGSLAVAADITAYASDARLKGNVVPISSAVDKVTKMSGVTFDWHPWIKDVGFEPSSMHDVGVLAQDVQAVLPEAVKLAPFDWDMNDPSRSKSKSGENYLTVQYEKLTALLIEAVKEQQRTIEDQGLRIMAIENLLNLR